jgi:hypothetical protein
MCVFKGTDQQGEGVWRMMCAVSPPEAVLPTFNQIKGVVTRFEREFCKTIDICKNDCIAYINTVNLPSPYSMRHAHRTKCPVCNHPRYITDPKTGKARPIKVIYHFPIAPFIRSLFLRPDLVPLLYTDDVSSRYNEGHVTRSRGFKRKITDNPHMNADPRNVALVGTTDGVPFFKDQVRGGWPFIFRCS